MRTEALVGSGGDLGVFVGRPLTVVLLLIALAAWSCRICRRSWVRLRGGDGGPAAFGGGEA